MVDFNFYLNRQGVRGKQGEKGDKGEQGYSPYIEIKTDTPTEFVMTVYNESESFDTPNLIPQAIGEKIEELDSTVTQHTSQIDTLNNEYNAVTDRLEAHTDDLMQIMQKDKEQDENLDNLNIDNNIQKQDITNLYAANQRINNSILELSYSKQNKLVEGDNITLTNNADGTTTISSVGGGTLPDNIAYLNTGNHFQYYQSIANEHFSHTGLAIGQKNTYDDDVSTSTPNISITGNEIKFGGALPDGYKHKISSGSELDIEASAFNVNGDPVITKSGLKAGDNITITEDSTDGKLVINSTGGGGSETTPIATTSIAGKVKPDGTTITVTEDGTISATSSSPANAVTTDTTQTITGFKTFTASNGISIINGSGQTAIASNSLSIKNGSTIVLGASYTGSYALGYSTTLTANKNLTIKTTFSNGAISLEPYSNNLSSLKYRNSNNTSNPSYDILHTGNLIAGDGITISEPDATGVRTISSSGGGSGEAPANMVTTDTAQSINGAKTFNVGTTFGSYITISSSRSGANQYSEIKGSAYVNHINSANINQCWAFNRDPRYSASITSGESTSQLNNYEPYLRKGNITVGDGITIEETRDASNNITGIKISATGGGGSSDASDEYGIRADYAIHHGIVDNPNGIITYSAANKDITVQQGLVLNCAGNGSAKTTIATAISHTVTTIGEFTLFYANGNLLECGKVDYSTVEPEDNGVDNYQAWFNPDKTANPNQQWQFKSNDTGNVFRYVESATPIADIVASSEGITSVSYLGYRVTDDDIFVTTTGTQNIPGLKNFTGGTVGLGDYSTIKATGLGNFTFGSIISQGYGTINVGNIVTDNGRKMTFYSTAEHSNGYVGYSSDSKFGIGRSEDNAADNSTYPVTVRGHLVNYNGGAYLKDTDTEIIAHQAMPSTRYVDLTLGASGTTYVAPADGYFLVTKALNSSGSVVLTGRVKSKATAPSDLTSAQSFDAHIPVSKGETVELVYTNGHTKSSDLLRFVYAEGTPSA